MIHWLWTAINTYLLHPEHGNGYQWHSGIEGNIQELTIFGAIVIHFKHKNCHHKGCWSIHTHPHPKFGWSACKTHWKEIPEHTK